METYRYNGQQDVKNGSTGGYTNTNKLHSIVNVLVLRAYRSEPDDHFFNSFSGLSNLSSFILTIIFDRPSGDVSY